MGAPSASNAILAATSRGTHPICMACSLPDAPRHRSHPDGIGVVPVPKVPLKQERPVAARNNRLGAFQHLRKGALASSVRFAEHLLHLHLMDHYSPAQVQKQLGHSSITMTVDTYGPWIPGEGSKDLGRTLGDKIDEQIDTSTWQEMPSAEVALKRLYGSSSFSPRQITSARSEVAL